jgi:hypothetical protein
MYHNKTITVNNKNFIIEITVNSYFVTRVIGVQLF